MSNNLKSTAGSRWTAAKKPTATTEEHRSKSPVETKHHHKEEVIEPAVSVTTKEAESVVEEEEESKGESNFSEFPEITANTIKSLNDRGITDLFPIQTK